MLSFCIAHKRRKKRQASYTCNVGSEEKYAQKSRSAWILIWTGSRETCRQSNKRTSLRVPEPQLMLDDFHHSIRSLLALQKHSDRQYILLLTQSVGWEVVSLREWFGTLQ